MTVDVEKAAAKKVTVEDLREFRRILLPRVFVGQILIDAVLVVLFATTIHTNYTWIVTAFFSNSPILALFLIKRLSWLENVIATTAAQQKDAERRRLELFRVRIADAALRGFIWRTFCDDVGVVRKSVAARAIFIFSTSSLLLLWSMGARTSTLCFVPFFAATTWAMVAWGREQSLMTLAKTVELFPSHLEIQLLRSRRRDRIGEYAPSIVLAILAYAIIAIVCREYLVITIMMCVPLILSLLAHWESGETEMERRARRIRLARGVATSPIRRAWRWWTTDWGIVRPVVIFAACIAYILMAILTWFVFQQGFRFEQHCGTICVLWMSFALLCMFPAARWKMIAAREARGGPAQPAMTEPRP
ncbi:MAG: hypothetical protein IT350_04545 [Deltaproteobacteria bacterium]|nr:hypothetical protein [Deltaproteobacteria bacterium]